MELSQVTLDARQAVAEMVVHTTPRENAVRRVRTD